MNSLRRQIMLAGLLLFLGSGLALRANVYATDFRLNGSLQAGVTVPGHPVAISFVLNETASHVLVQIYAGTNVVKTFASASGAPGTNAGLNTVFWDGTDDAGQAAAVDVYNVRITAAAPGFETWTNITDDGTNFDVFLPTSIAVNKNTNSPYYGRIFIGNGRASGGVNAGILKCNADGSPAEEGGFGTGGYAWGGGGYLEPSPWKMDVGADDRLYVDDWSGNGVVISLDEVLSTNYLDVLRPDNYPYPKISLSGLCVAGAGTNRQIFMADYNPLALGGLGILAWNIDSNGVVAPNDTGMVEVALSTNGSDLTLAPYAVTLGTNNCIYTIQRIFDTNATDPTVLSFPPLPNGDPAETNAIWEIDGPNSTLFNNYGVAVDSGGRFVAVATRGHGDDPLNLQDGGLSIFMADSGSLVTNMTQNAQGGGNQEFFDVAWDNIGNLYALYGEDGLSQTGWRVYSPPGSNVATTVAVPVIQVYNSITPAQLSQPAASAGQFNFTLLGQSNVTYVIQQSADLINWTAVATNFSPASVLPVSLPTSAGEHFLRALAIP